MRHFTGNPSEARDCKPGDLVRFSHDGVAVFGFTASGSASGEVDRIIALIPGAPTELLLASIDCPAINYGRDYQIEEIFGPNSLSPKDIKVAGTIQLRCSKADGQQSATLVCKSGVNGGITTRYSIEEGRTSGQRGGVGIELLQWQVVMGSAESRTVVYTFENE